MQLLQETENNNGKIIIQWQYLLEIVAIKQDFPEESWLSSVLTFLKKISLNPQILTTLISLLLGLNPVTHEFFFGKSSPFRVLYNYFV